MMPRLAQTDTAQMQYNSAIWLLSDGRSGSTWFSQVLNFHGCFHVEHEPVHTMFTPGLQAEDLLPMPTDPKIDTLYAPLLSDILDAKYITNRFGDSADSRDELIVRDIFALLIAPKLLRRFPQIRPVVIVRHPSEVANSKLSLPQWKWFCDVERFAKDRLLCATFPDLAQHIDQAKTLYQKYVLSWAVCHGYFFANVDRSGVTVVRYPSPRPEIVGKVEAILREAGVDWKTATPEFDAAWEQRSATDRPAKAESMLARLFARKEPSPSQRDWAERIIDQFGLRWLVSEPTYPALRGNHLPFVRPVR